MTIDRRQALSAIGALSVLAGASPLAARTPAVAPEAPDGVRWVTLSNGYKVWTQRLGRSPRKVLLLHGGPGFSHDYMQCFADFLPRAGYEMYFYDQLGCGRSDQPKDTHLWTLERYVQEVEEVRAALGLDQFVLVGHSWGGILGIEYTLRHQARLRGFVLSDMTASFADFAAYTAELKAQLPAPVRSQLLALERAGKSGSDEYSAIVQMELYTRYICRLDPWPAPLKHSFDVANDTIYRQLQGPNEFVITGSLQAWDRWADLRRIHVPTLVTGARYDEMNPESVLREAKLIPNAELFMSKTGSHLAMWDDQASYFAAVLQFLHKAYGS